MKFFEWTMTSGLGLGFALCLLIGVAMPIRAAFGADESAEPFRVVLLRSTSMYLPAAILQDQAMRDSLIANTRRNIEIYAESLDTMRFPSKEFEAEFLRMLRLKFKERKIDLLLPLAGAALDFAQRHRADLWPGVPIVFYSVAEDSLKGIQLEADVTGAILPFDLPGTIRLATRLQPNARRIVVVSGTSSYDKNWLRRAREVLLEYEKRFDVSYRTDERLADLLAALGKLPADTIVLYLSFSRDANGKSYVAADMARLLAEASSAPVYGALATYIGQGVVGGVVPRLAAHGKLAGEIGARVLGGQKASEIPVQPSPAPVPTVDWRQLERWRLNEKNLPPEAVIQFREGSFWRLYRWQLLAVGTVVILEGVLIVGLLLQRNKRRRVQDALQQSEARYRALVMASAEMVWRADADGRGVFITPAWMELTGQSVEEARDFGWLQAVHPGDRGTGERLWEQAIHRKHAYENEMRIRCRDGNYRHFHIHAVPIRAADGSVREWVGMNTDISERKRMHLRNEELIHHLGERVKELTALHRTARILQDDRQTTAEWLRQIVDLLPPAWQYPEITAARIRLGELAVATPNFKQTSWTQRADFALAEGHGGSIEVVYLEERPAEQEGPFLKEERNLIDSLAEMLRAAIEHRRAEQMLRNNETVLRASHDRIQDLVGRLINAQEAERSRIARELHDDVNQQLAGLSIALSNVKRRLQAGDNGTIDTELSRLQQRVIDVADAIRGLSHDLHPGVLQHAGLVAALRGHCSEFGKQHGIDVTLSIAETVNGVPPDIALCLYRVAQEGLRNVAAHAAASAVKVALHATGDTLELSIADDGQGFCQDRTYGEGGLGLISLDERVRLVGGSFNINTEPRRGTELRAQVPLRKLG